MSFIKSNVENAALEWFRELGYATFHRHQTTLSDSLSVRDILGEIGQPAPS